VLESVMEAPPIAVGLCLLCDEFQRRLAVTTTFSKEAAELMTTTSSKASSVAAKPYLLRNVFQSLMVLALES